MKFTITNLTCDACVKLSVFALQKIKGVIDAYVDLHSGVATVNSQRELIWAEVAGALQAVGKKAVITK